MGTVYAALDSALDREVAIKVPTRSLVASPDAHDRFVRETRALAAVKHDHIVTIHSVEESNGQPYMVMELIDGQSLEQRLADGSPLEVAEVVRIAIETADALFGRTRARFSTSRH